MVAHALSARALSLRRELVVFVVAGGIGGVWLVCQGCHRRGVNLSCRW
mgnify:CR=1 FL=1